MFGLDEIQKGPEFLGIVLNGCSCEQCFPQARQPRQSGRCLGLFILQPVCLIKDDMLEGNFAQFLKVADEQLVVGEQNLKLGHF